MQNKKDVVVVGELNVDLILNGIHGFPAIGTEILADRSDLTLGSSSAIMAANIASLGVSTAFCGMIGKDNFGDLVLGELKRKNVDTTFVTAIDEHATGLTVVMNYDQDRANVTYCGAMEALTINSIPWDAFSDFRHMHLSNFFIQKGLRDDIVEIFRKAKEAGVTTSLDLQWDPDNKWDFDYQSCLPYVDVFMPNEAELMALTSSGSIEEGIEKVRPYLNMMALKMGQKGSLGVTPDHIVEQPSFSHNCYVDSIGAGDSFNSGFIKKYIEGAPVEECLKYGNLMGALNTTAAGGTKAFGDKETVIRSVKEIFGVEIK